MSPRLMISGPYLADSLRVDDAAEIPCRAGVYLWRRVLRYDPMLYSNYLLAENWIRQQAEAPLASLASLQLSTARGTAKTSVRPSFVLLRELRIGAACLQGKQLLPEGADDRGRVLETLEELLLAFGPVLYVGESSDLRRRVREHLRGETGFVERLQECGLGLGDVALSYVVLDPFPDSCRFQIEELLTHLVGAPLTRKAGA